MARKVTDEERVALAELITGGAVLLSTVIKLAFDKMTEAEAVPKLNAQSGVLLDAVEKFAEVIK